jgi:hypothetical protein
LLHRKVATKYPAIFGGVFSGILHVFFMEMFMLLKLLDPLSLFSL